MNTPKIKIEAKPPVAALAAVTVAVPVPKPIKAKALAPSAADANVKAAGSLALTDAKTTAKKEKEPIKPITQVKQVNTSAAVAAAVAISAGAGASVGAGAGAVDGKVKPPMKSKLKPKRAKTVDETYTEKDERQHVLDRPDTQIGSTKFAEEHMWVLDRNWTPDTADAEHDADAQATPAAAKTEATIAVDGKDSKEGKDVKEGKEGKEDVPLTPVARKKAKGLVRKARMVYRKCRYVPGLYKIVDEPLVNATDAVQLDVGVTVIKVDINVEAGNITIYNNGNGLPVEKHGSGLWVPEFVFGRMRTSSNFDDEEQRVTGGRNGYGIKCSNIMSTKFVVEVQDANSKLHYKQTWTNNMADKGDAKVTKCEKSGYVKITFYPDFKRFGMAKWDDDILALLEKRVYDIAATCPKVKVVLNGTRVPIKSFHDYVMCFTPDPKPSSDDSIMDDEGCVADPEDKKDPAKGDGEQQPAASGPVMVYERVNKRWEVCVMASDGTGFQQMSFVNSICTSKGGRHVDVVVEQLIAPIRSALKKKSKGGEAGKIAAATVKNHLFVFVNAIVVNPAFDSQTKMTLMTDKSEFGSECVLSEKTIKKVLKSSIVTNLLELVQHKSGAEFRKTDGKQRGDPKVDKLSDATATSTKDRQKCTLILTEGDSAKALAMAGLSVIGRKMYGVFALKGKPVNPRDEKLAKIVANKEFAAIKKALGLKNGEKYTDTSLLRYGHIWIMADADKDGIHIVALVLNMLAFYWPELMQIPDFIRQFITPIVKATKGKKIIAFYSEVAYGNWKAANEDGKGWIIKWYKGLGTSSSQEGKEYFSDIPNHTIPFRWSGPADNLSLELAFGKKKNMADKRKVWIGAYKTIDPLHPELNSTDAIEAARRQGHTTVSEFINRQLILYSIANNERHIPSMVDGLKHSGRKIVFACFKRNLVREIKVASLAGYVIEQAAYQHGEASCTGTIVGIAQNFVGANNINLLMPSGQFGTRMENGNDAASPRYINTYLSPVARFLMVPDDDALLIHLMDEGQKIEPIYYLPILPLFLISGCEDCIGTGWSSESPPHNPRDIARLIKLLMSGATVTSATHPLTPWIKDFKGTITPDAHKRQFCVRGSFTIKDDTTNGGKQIVITEIPPGRAMSDYCADLKKLVSDGRLDKVQDETTEEEIRYILSISDKQLASVEKKGGLYKFLKLESSIGTNNIVAFNSVGQLKHYASVHDILNEFFQMRLPFYAKRKAVLLQNLALQLSRLANRARFILMVIEEKSLTVRNQPLATIVTQLQKHGFPLLPKRSAKSNNANGAPADDGDEEDKDMSSEVSPVNKTVAELEKGYDYLLGMPLWSLTLERVAELKNQHAKKKAEIDALQNTEPTTLWTRDIDAFLAALDKHEAKEREDKRTVVKKESKKLPSSAKKPLPVVVASKRKLVELKRPSIPLTAPTKRSK